ncbi:lipase [Holotrichia oblita]|uniref:Lipase n=1 Tax=Holotrichia oblita TaxID=644536 RepID=A0ACB9T415_HOLOL|nr:lipase [Holotrichia oblita]
MFIQSLIVLAFIITGVQGDRVSEDDITFYISNTRYSYKPISSGNYTNLYLDPTKDVKIICHGWIDSVSTTWYTDAKDQYALRGRTNVIGVDWSSHSVSLYSLAVRRVQSVGYYVALLIADMSANFGIPLSKFHIIGHSLGSHIAGFAGQYVQSIVHEKVGRITGLDPARPFFEGNAIDERLSDDDANFVDVIHTNGGTLGYKASIGHVDYYPNGGSEQKGCGILLRNSCSHNRAPTFFYESINDNGFVAFACSSQNNFDRGNCDGNERIIMGENVDQNARGDFYLNTASSSPFALS